METNITRRRVLQGVGAAGVVGIAGNTIVGAQEDGEGQDQSTAIRVAHASPDAPSVDVRLNEVQDGAAGNETAVGGNQTADNETADNESDGGDGGILGGGDDGDQDGPLIEGLEFRSVSDYNEVDPGTYQLQVVATEQSGLLEDIFGGDSEERIVFDQEVEIEEGTTYTAVAYGELAQADLGPGVGVGNETVGNDTGQPGDLGNETGDDNETGLPGGNETVGDDNETAPIGAGNETGPAGDNETGPVGDNETAPPDGFGNETAGNETVGDEGQAPEDGQVVVDELSFGEHETFEAPAGDYTLEIRETSARTGGDAPGVPGDAGNETAGNDTGMPDEIDNETSPIGEGEETGNETGAPGDADNETTPPVSAGNETTPIADGAGNETVGTGDDALGVGGMDQSDDQAFQVDILEDDLSAPAEEQSRVRVFHAVPDADAVRIVATESEGDDGGGLFGGGGNASEDNQTGDNATAGQDNQTGGDAVGDDAGVGQDNGTVGQDNGTVGNDTAVGQGNETAGDGGAGDRVQEAEVSLEAGTVYSGFALGYFDPQAAGQDGAAGNETDGDNVTIGGAGNDTAGGGMDNDTVGDDTGGGVGGQDNATGDGAAVGQDNATGDGNETTGADGLATDAEGEEFELVVVEDASDGERADGGTGGGGLLPDAAAPEAASD